MSEINKTSQQSLQRILDKIGIKSANEKKEEVNQQEEIKEPKKQSTQSKPSQSSEPVKTPMEDPIDEIKPHSTVVSPIL